jgi:hypothetical protein
MNQSNDAVCSYETTPDGFTPYYHAKLTVYNDMNDPSNIGSVESGEIMKHLAADANNAIVLRVTSRNFAVWNAPGGFFFQELPLEDPGDAEIAEGTDFPDFLYAIFDHIKETAS